MKTDYSVQLQGATDVASADPSSAARAIQMQGQAISQAIESTGSTMFEMYEGYKGEKLRQSMQDEYDYLKWEMNSTKDAEQRNNLLANSVERTPEAVQSFQRAQERIGQAVLQMPERAAEFRMRSSKILRESIAQNPGMANSFRQIAQQVTGIKDLDMYSVTHLYDEIDMVAKRQQDAARAAAKADEDTRKLFIKDMSNIMSDTEANAAYSKLSPDQRVQIASEAFKTEQRKKHFDESLKAGGNAIHNGVTSLIADLNTGNIAMMAASLKELEEVGVDSTSMASGKLTESQMSNPKLPVVLSKVSAVHRKYIDDGYVKGNSQIRAALANGVVDRVAANAALSDMQKWYDGEVDKLNKYGAGPLLAALAGSSESDPQKTLDVRLRSINAIAESFNIDPNVAAGLLSSDETRRGAARAEHAQWGAALDHIDELRRAAMRGAANTEWFSLIRKAGELKAANTVVIPRTKDERTATVIQIEDLMKTVRDGAALGKAETPSTLKLITGGFAMKDAADKLMKEYSKAIEQQIRLIPPGEQGAFDQQVKTSYENAVYGAVGHGDVAWSRLQVYKPDTNPFEFAQGSSTVFVDQTGATPLKMQHMATPKHNLTPAQQMAYERYNQGAESPKEVNNTLSAVDAAIRVRSMTTGEDVRVLRKEFMENFVKGKPSEVYSSSVSADKVEAATKAVTPEAPAATPKTTTGPLRQEKQLPAAIQGGVEDMKETLAGLKANLNDVKEGSPLHARLKADIAEVEKELKRQGVKL